MGDLVFQTLGLRSLLPRRGMIARFVFAYQLWFQPFSPWITREMCWGQPSCLSSHRKGKQNQLVLCASGHRGWALVCLSPKAEASIKQTCCLILFTTLTNLYFECYREFQTEYLLCDCNILWMHRWVKERNITVRDTRCVYPKSLQAQPVTGVKQELLTCGKGEGKAEEGFAVFYLLLSFSWQSESSLYTVLELITTINLHGSDNTYLVYANS